MVHHIIKYIAFIGFIENNCAGILSAGKNAKVEGSGLTGVPVSPFGPGTPGRPGDPWKMQGKDTMIDEPPVNTLDTVKLSCSSFSAIPGGLVVQ